jgi:hypothetical protein
LVREDGNAAAGVMSRSVDGQTQELGVMDQAEGRDGDLTGNGEAWAPREEPTLGYVAPMGTEVRGVDGARLGQVAAAWPSHVFVEMNPGADAGYWVPVEAFAGTEGAALVLSVTRDEAERRGWTERPLLGPE